MLENKKLKEIIDKLDVGFFEGEFKGKLLIHNRAINQILGLDLSQNLAGMMSSEFFATPDEHQRYLNEIERYGCVKDFISKIRKPNGDLIYVQINAHLVTEDGKVPETVEGTVIDVTEKYLLEQKLKEAKKRFKLILDNSNDLIAILNKNFEHEFINEKAYFEVLGYRTDEIIGKRPRDFAHPEDIKRVSKAIKKGLLKGDVSEEFRIRHKKGHYKWIEINGKFLRENNDIIGVILISRDISEKKQAEQKLKDSEKKYRTLFESSTDGIYSTDMEGNFIEVNKAFSNFLGYTKKELLKFNNRQITPKSWHDIEDNMVFTELSEGESKAYEKEFIKKNGTIVPVSIRFWILFDEQGDPYRIWAIVRDITDRKQIERELKEVSQLKSDFLRRASHELKTPLISIKGFSDLILKLYKEELNQDIILKLGEINQGCERLQHIINDLLHTSKLESPDLRPKFIREDLSFLIKFCIKELNPLAEKREQSIDIDIQENIMTYFEKEEIHDVISNLLRNAIKYTSPKGKIKIKSDLKDDNVVISFEDNGIGFTEEEKKKVFQQFGKIERFGQGLDLGIDGTGLGLYISKKIVEAHGGQIWMESEGRNKGSTFFFSLPIRDN